MRTMLNFDSRRPSSSASTRAAGDLAGGQVADEPICLSGQKRTSSRSPLRRKTDELARRVWNEDDRCAVVSRPSRNFTVPSDEVSRAITAGFECGSAPQDRLEAVSTDLSSSRSRSHPEIDPARSTRVKFADVRARRAASSSARSIDPRSGRLSAAKLFPTLGILSSRSRLYSC